MAKVQPDAVAVLHGSESVTFAQLDALVAETAAELTSALKLSPLPRGSFVPTLIAHEIASVVLIHAGFRAAVPMGLIDSGLPETEMKERLAALGPSDVVMAHERSTNSLLTSKHKIVFAAKKPGRLFDPVNVTPESDFLVLFTSGTTGRAKGIVHGPEFVTTALASLGEILGSGPGRGPIASIGPFHWGGGSAALHQLLNGRSIAILPIDGGNAGTLVEAFRSARVESAVLPPSLAVWLAHNNVGLPLSDLEKFALGGESISLEHLDILKKLLKPSTSISTVWGASEMTDFLFSAVHAGASSGGSLPINIAPDSPIRLEPSDEDPPSIHGGIVGEIVVRGIVAHGYLGQPELTELRFGRDPDGVRFWRSGDLAELCPDGRLFLRGRKDDMVKINGKLVEPAESLALLRAVPSLRTVEVLPHTLSSGRIVLVAHVVADDNASPDAIRQMLMQRLPVHVIPGVLMRHESLPINDRGKVDRQALQSMEPVAWLETKKRAPETAVEKFLFERLEEILESSNFGVDDDIWFLGLDSLGAVELLTAITDIGFGELAPNELLQNRTIRTLARQLEDGVNERTTDVVIFNPEIEGDTLFCIPGGGGTAINFRPLADCFASSLQLVAIENHGMHTHGKPDRSIEAMAQRVVATVQELQPVGVLRIVGYSAGGHLAWEASRRLEEMGRQVRLIVIDSSFARETERRGQVRIEQRSNPSPKLSLSERLRRYLRWRKSQFVRRYRRLHPGRPRVNELRYLAFLDIMVRALNYYEPQPVNFPVLYLASQERSDLESWNLLADDFTLQRMAGDHYSMLKAPHVAAVASAISEWMNEASESQQRRRRKSNDAKRLLASAKDTFSPTD